MDISKIEMGECPSAIHAVIEIPLGSSIKYELDKESGAIFVDRIVYGPMAYPANYGFVPNTLADDGDPADILVITDYALIPGSVIKVRLIGALIMEDESGQDEKLLAVPVKKVDPRYENVQSYKDLPQLTQDRIKNFFETYKLLEPGKWVKIKDFVGVEEACRLLINSKTKK